MDKVAKQFAGKLKVAKLDVDKAQDIAIKYGVMSIPTLLFFKDGKEVDRIVGAVKESELVSRVEKVLAGA